MARVRVTNKALEQKIIEKEAPKGFKDALAESKQSAKQWLMRHAEDIDAALFALLLAAVGGAATYGFRKAKEVKSDYADRRQEKKVWEREKKFFE